MLTLEQYKKYEDNIQGILDQGVNINTLAPIPDDFESKMDITFEEHFAFQNAQARAHASGVISTEVAQIIYSALGEVLAPINENGGWQPGVTCARKVTITNLMGELMTRA